jgi:hypothetical protein
VESDRRYRKNVEHVQPDFWTVRQIECKYRHHRQNAGKIDRSGLMQGPIPAADVGNLEKLNIADRVRLLRLCRRYSRRPGTTFRARGVAPARSHATREP